MHQLKIRLYQLILLVFSPLVLYSQAPPLQWVLTYPTSSNNICKDILIDKDGYRYIMGTFSGLSDFNGSSGYFPVQSKNNNESFIMKTDSTGNISWFYNLPGVNLKKLHIKDGSLYMTGTFFGIVDFDPGGGTTMMTSGGNTEAFIAKWDTSGNFIWSAVPPVNVTTYVENLTSDTENNAILTTDTRIIKYSPTGNVLYNLPHSFVIHSVITDPNNNVLLTGKCGANTDLDPGPGVYKIPSLTSSSNYISKLDSSGNLLWAKGLNGNFYNPIYPPNRLLSIDSAMNIYIAGTMKDSVDFNPDTTINSYLFSTHLNSPYIARYDAFGNYIGAKVIDIEGTIASMTVDGDQIIIAGTFKDTSDFDPGPGITLLNDSANFFICKFTASLDLAWAKNIGGRYSGSVSQINIDENSNVIATGNFIPSYTTYFKGYDLDPGPGLNIQTATGSGNVLICTLDSNGNFKSAHNFSAAMRTLAASKTDAFGSIYSTGKYNGCPDYDTDTLTITPLEYAPKNRTYISKINTNGQLEWITTFTGKGSNEGTLLDLDQNGNTIIAGTLDDSISFGPFNGTYTDYGKNVSYIAKVSPSGNVIWGKTLSHWIDKIDVDPMGNIFLSGSFYDSIDVDPGAGIHYINTIDNGNGIFLVKLDASGNFNWGYAFGRDGISISSRNILADDNSIYITGDYSWSGSNDSIDFDPGPGQALMGYVSYDPSFILKMNTNGTFNWVKLIRGNSAGGNYSYINSIHRRNDQLYLAGSYDGTIDLNPGAAIDLITATDTNFSFVLVLDTTGNFVWKNMLNALPFFGSRTITTNAAGNMLFSGGTISSSGGNSSDVICELNNAATVQWYSAKTIFYNSDSRETMNIEYDNFDNIYTVGEFCGTKTDFDINAGFQTVHSSTLSDIYYAKYGNNVVNYPEAFQNTISQFSVYPNPCHDYFYIKRSNNSTIPISLYDMQGRIILQTNHNLESPIDISNIPPGIYILASTSDFASRVKIVINR